MPRLADPHARDAGRRDGGDPGRAQRVAALVAAYHAGIAAVGNGTGGHGTVGNGTVGNGTVAFGWVRTAAGGPVRVIAAGRALVGSALPDSAHQGSDAADADAGEAEVLLALPGGARATALPPGRLAGLLSEVGCWRAIAGISDGLLVPAGGPGEPRSAGAGGGGGAAGLSLDEGLLGSWTGPFGWLVVAEPVAPAHLRALSEEAGLRQRLAEGSADRFPDRAAQALRLKGRHAELQRGVSAGLWRITIAAGGRDPASAARVAGLLCASVDLGGLPYTLCPAPPPPPPPTPILRSADSNPAPTSNPGVTPSRLRLSTGRPSCWPRSPGRRRPRCQGSAWRSGPTSTSRLRVPRARSPGRRALSWVTSLTGTCARPGRSSCRGLAQPARVRLRLHRGRQVADRPVRCSRPRPTAASPGWWSSPPRPSTG